MTCEEFKKKHIYGLKNLKNTTGASEIEYRPAHSLADFKFSKKFPVIKVYNKKEDCTHLFIYCAGIIDLFPYSNSQEGYAMKFKGYRKDIVNDLLKTNSFTNFLLTEYNKHEEKMEEYRRERAKEEA